VAAGAQELGPDVVAMQCRQESMKGAGEIKQRRLVKGALRMRPSRIIVGGVRREESLDLSSALHSGWLQQIHVAGEARSWGRNGTGLPGI
jgi:Flp pilus assembly CpaF family ATPase